MNAISTTASHGAIFSTASAARSQASIYHDAQEYTSLDDAIGITKQRLSRIQTISSQSNVPESCGQSQLQRLSKRLRELECIHNHVESNHLKCIGFSGWQSGNQSMLSHKGHSQFETVFIEMMVKGQKRQIEIPLGSRIQHFNKRDVDLIKHTTQHGSHSHNNWLAKSVTQQQSHKTLREDEEGCPCCMAGLDFDEFAAALKEVSGSQNGHEHFADLPAVDSAQHWGVLLGITGPLGVIGLAAAIRNIKGTIKTRKNLNLIMKSLSEDIEHLKKTGNIKQAYTLMAFRRTLKYSKFDTNFNLIVPGIINGAASLLVLSTAFVSHPIALPAIAVYAACQFARNTYDLFRIRKQKVKKSMRDSVKILHGKSKLNQITTSKRKFYTSNAFGFACFAAGAVITFLSIPAIGFFGAGAVTLPIGLTLLTFGALFTGISNNIWPRKFKPRNGDLGIERTDIQSGDQILELLDDRRQVKKTLQTGLPLFKPHHQHKKRLLKFLTALPELKDFLPSKMASPVSKQAHRYIPFLPYTGSGASDKKHKLNLAMAKGLHKDQAASNNLQQLRVNILQQLVNQDSSTQDEKHMTYDNTLEASWKLLQKLGLEKQVLEVWINEGFINKGEDIKINNACSGDSCSHEANNHAHKEHNHAHKEHNHAHKEHNHAHKEHNHAHKEHNHAHKEHNHAHKEQNQDHEGNSHKYVSHFDVPGITQREDWLSFNFKKFQANASVEALQHFNSAMDYFLFYQHEKKMRYQQYGLADFYWQFQAVS